MKTRVSALMDGECSGFEYDATLHALSRDGEAADAWRAYHLIGDTIRGTVPLSAGFSRRFADRLAVEPTVLAPRLVSPARGRVRRLALPVAASVAAISLVASLAVDPGPSTPLAQAPRARVEPALEPARGPSTAPQQSNLALPRAADDYLFAHQTYSPRAALQGVMPYVRAVADSTARGNPR